MIHVLYSRAGIATQIILNNVLVDAGDGTLRDLLAAAYNFDDLDVIIITHGHYDHMGGLHTLLGYLRMIGRKKILKILHPGAREVETLIKGFQTCYRGTIPFPIDLVRVEDRQIYNVNKARIQPFFVCHAGSTAQGIMPSIPATGYKILFDNMIVAVTGDSCMCTALKELVSGADIAFIEATWTEERKEMLTKKHGDIEEDMLSVHLSEEQAESLGKLAKKYVLIHK